MHEREIAELWARPMEACDKMYEFFRDFAAYCMVCSPLTVHIETVTPSDLGNIFDDGGSVVETLLSCCK